jgi:hypothetical protein
MLIDKTFPDRVFAVSPSPDRYSNLETKTPPHFICPRDLRCLRNTIHMNLMCSYILADFMWIFVYSLQVCVNHPGLLTPNKQDLIGGNLPNSWTKIETHYRKTNIWRANSDILHFAALAPIFCLKSTRICAVHF